MTTDSQSNDTTPLTADEKRFMDNIEAMLADGPMYEEDEPHTKATPEEIAYSEKLMAEAMAKVHGEWAPLIDPIVADVTASLDAIDRLNAAEAAEQK